jgi:hypothetical protein
MRNTDTKLVNTLKKLYQGHEYTTTFEDEIISWNETYEEYIEEWEIKYYLILNQVLGDGSNAIVNFDVIVTDIIVDGDSRYHIWEEDGHYQDEWYISKVEKDLYDTIGTDFPLSFYFTFYGEDEYNNLPLDQKNL